VKGKYSADMGLAFRAGAAQVDITPRDSQFLYGYPHVRRYSTGIHDPLFSSALYLSDGKTETVIVANDIIFVGKALVKETRKRISEATKIPSANIMITATHTHSGPVTVDYISSERDPVVPKADPRYLSLLQEGMISAAVRACGNSAPATVDLSVADGTGVGTNRRDPSGPVDPETPVMAVRHANSSGYIACMLVFSMHPTVLHEDSTLISCDFPGVVRRYLQSNYLGEDCPVLYHTGPAGNQSPRHVVRGNTFAEAERLGTILGKAAGAVLTGMDFSGSYPLKCIRAFLDLLGREFPSVEDSRKKLVDAKKRFEDLKQTRGDAREIRTAECDWFGAEETASLALAARDGRISAYYDACMPAEVQVIRIGPWSFVGWQGEIFVEYALAVKRKFQDTFIISLANGELQGYIVTEEAAFEGGYEASNSLFKHESGNMMVEKTASLLERL
jgi:hypothetical protein